MSLSVGLCLQKWDQHYFSVEPNDLLMKMGHSYYYRVEFSFEPHCIDVTNIGMLLNLDIEVKRGKY